MSSKSLACLLGCAALICAEAPLHAQTAAPAPAPAAPPTPTPAQAAAASQPVDPGAAALQTPAELARRPVLEIEGLEVHPGGLTSLETARRTLATGSTVREKRAELDAAIARIAQTTAQFFPRVTLSASYMYIPEIKTELGGGAFLFAENSGPVGVVPDPGGDGQIVIDSMGRPVGAAEAAFLQPEHNYALNAQLSVPLSDYILRLSDAAAAASASRDAAKYAMEAEERRVLTDSRVLYYNWLRAHAQVFIAERAVERTRARLADARAAFEVGRISQADVLRIEALVANAELALAQAQSGRALGGAQLAIIMSDRGGGEYQIGESLPDLETMPPPNPGADATRKLIAEANAKRLEFKAVQAAVRALEYGESAARADTWPKLAVVGDATYANPNQRFFPPEEKWNFSWSVGAVASISLDAPFMASARGDELAAQLEAARGRVTLTEASIASQVVNAHVGIIRAYAALSAGTTALRAAEEAYRVTTELFAVGRGTATDLIDAESELLNAKLTITNARIDLVIAALQLDYAVGRDERIAIR